MKISIGQGGRDAGSVGPAKGREIAGNLAFRFELHYARHGVYGSPAKRTETVCPVEGVDQSAVEKLPGDTEWPRGKTNQ